ncbi:aldo/keto reductase [Aestuariivirga litoralis]|uniref:aldo/keto reductase n=1 Tax=Aestuariivirga litoralis TaxID=2650924 RepID=UPI0018C4D86B|nr:aldo/keto reductase [Aestuariivirga litoralis]MBG1232189.1 aldo/keto reductase [Aestuariivirga litoralis]
MKQRMLGKGGPMVGEVGFGAMSFGGIFGPTNVEESHKALDKALELGVTHIDTALIYGPHTSEEVLGAYLKKNPAARKQFSIATKGGIQTNPRAIINNDKFLRDCIEGSLKRLGVDHVDLYYIHRREQAVPIEDVAGTLQTFIKEGKIGGMGFSEISPASLERASKLHHVRAVQNEYSLWARQPELGMIEACARHGTALVAFSPLARGTLADAVFDPKALPASDWRLQMPRLSDDNWPRNATRIEAFRRFANSRGWTTEALALAWVLARAPHIIPIPGTRTSAHLARNAAASSIKLTAEDMGEINRLLPAGWSHGHRYNESQQAGVEQYC